MAAVSCMRMLRPWDGMLILVVAAGTVAPLAWHQGAAPADWVIVERAGMAPLRLEARGTQTVDLETRLGTYRLEVRDGGVRLITAACPQQRCLRQGWLRKPGGRPIICLPAGLIIRLSGPAQAAGVDAVLP